MKRQLSLVLALVMILGSFSTVFAAMPTTEVDKAAFLGTKGVLKGNLEGDLKLADNLKRRDAVVLLSRLYGVEAEAKATNSDDLKFEDITDDFYKGFIAWSVNEGIVEGFSETEFAFNKEVKVQDYATMLLRVLKHDVNGDTYTKALADAEAKGILEGLQEVENMTTTTRGMAATMTFNALGVEVKGTGKTLAETLGIEMPEADVPAELEVEDVRTDNLKEIIVEFNDVRAARNERELVDIANYATSAGTIKNAELDGNNVVLVLVSPMRDNQKYEITVKRELTGSTIKKDFRAYDNTAPEVVSVEVLGTKGIRVRMSEPMPTNLDERQFLLGDTNIIMTTKVFDRDILLLPYKQDKTFPVGEHKLSVLPLADYAGFKSARFEETIEIKSESTAPVVKNIELMNTKAVIEFEEPVFPILDEKTVYFTVNQYRGKDITVKGDKVKAIAANKFEVEVTAPTRTVDVTVANFENYSGVVMDSHRETVSVELDYTRPVIVKHSVLSSQNGRERLELEFSKIMNADQKVNSDLAKYFSLYKIVDGKETEVKSAIKEVRYAGDDGEIDSKYVTVVFREGYIDEGITYKLSVGLLEDNTLLRNVMLKDDVQFVVGVAKELKVIGLRTSDKGETLEVKFNNKLDKYEAVDPSNYFIIVRDGVTERVERISDLSNDYKVTLHKDGYIVTINLPGLRKDILGIQVNPGLKDLDGNIVNQATNNFYINKLFVELKEARLVDDNKVELEFDQDVTVDKDATGVSLGQGTTIVKATYKGKVVTLEYSGAEPTDVSITNNNKIFNDFGNNAAVVTGKALVTKKAPGVNVAAVKSEYDAGTKKMTVTVPFDKAMNHKSVEENVKVYVGDKLIDVKNPNISTTTDTTYTAVFEFKDTIKDVKVEVEKGTEAQDGTKLAAKTVVELTKMTIGNSTTSPANLTVNAPGTHFEVEGALGTVTIEGISANSLEITTGAVKKVVVKTSKVFSIKGLKNAEIVAEGVIAKVKLAGAETATEIEVGKPVKLDEDGRVEEEEEVEPVEPTEEEKAKKDFLEELVEEINKINVEGIEVKSDKNGNVTITADIDAGGLTKKAERAIAKLVEAFGESVEEITIKTEVIKMKDGKPVMDENGNTVLETKTETFELGLEEDTSGLIELVKEAIEARAFTTVILYEVNVNKDNVKFVLNGSINFRKAE